MKNAWLTVGVVIALLIAHVALAEQKKLGTVSFDHDKHIKINEKRCDNCHEGGVIGKITGFDKEWAHRLCEGCHEVFSEGPTQCDGCHKKQTKAQK